jgi:hypothetical protein
MNKQKTRKDKQNKRIPGRANCLIIAARPAGPAPMIMAVFGSIANE